jgi:hypothetical protein
MYFPDLTPYRYGGREPPQPHILNVGWLSADQPFNRGMASEPLVAALRKLTAHPVNLFRGLHACEFCPPRRRVISPSGLRMVEPVPGTAGNGEIRVPAAGGLIYVAPVLVLHYVLAHQYLPPAEFIEAAIATASSF